MLVVDDTPIARAAAVTLFRDLGFEVYDAYEGATALRLLESKLQIGILFVDVRMPGMSGPELARAALRKRTDLRVVFTSGHVEPLGLPSDALFVPKPWTVDQVMQALVDEPA